MTQLNGCSSGSIWIAISTIASHDSRALTPFGSSPHDS